jgi:hypothetical protein
MLRSGPIEFLTKFNFSGSKGGCLYLSQVWRKAGDGGYFRLQDLKLIGLWNPTFRKGSERWGTQF